MIIKNVCLLLEALSILICLHHLYGEKFKLDIVTISYLSIHMILLTIINYFGLPKTYTMIMYLTIATYCGIKFGFAWKEIVANMVLCVILVGGLQIVISFTSSFILNTTAFADMKLLLVNCITTFVVVVILPKCNIKRLTYYIKGKSEILLMTICTCVVMVLFTLVNYKSYKLVEAESLILLFISIIFIFILSGQLNKYKVKSKEVETELRMQKLYADSFKVMIENIRLRQHEFDNHISMLNSMHLKYQTYEELVAEQKNYWNVVIKENRFHKLLSCGNSVIIGFLYGRFVEFDKKGIDISYQVSVQELEIGIPIHKIVEILGNLMNNAVEALLANEKRKKLHVSVIENGDLHIEVRNESPYITYKEIGNFFVKDYSQKGENRGLGLYNVKQICEEYGLDIACDNVDFDGENWLTFEIYKEKETT